MRISPKMYRAITVVALPLASLLPDVAFAPPVAYRRFWNERFAWTTFPRRTEKPRVWIHAVSVGDQRRASADCGDPAPLGGLRRPLTHMTDGPRRARSSSKMAPAASSSAISPTTRPTPSRSSSVRPVLTLGVIMETEVYNSWEASRLGIPMVLANARESEKSMKKAEKYIDVMKPAFESFSVILAQSSGQGEARAPRRHRRQEDAAQVRHHPERLPSRRSPRSGARPSAARACSSPRPRKGERR